MVLSGRYFLGTDRFQKSVVQTGGKRLSNLFFNSLNLNAENLSYAIDATSKSGTFVSYILDKFAEAYSLYAKKNDLKEADVDYLTYDEDTGQTTIASLGDLYHINHRSKTCLAFDCLTLIQAENCVFGSPSSVLNGEGFYRHFSLPDAEILASMDAEMYPEATQYASQYQSQASLEEVKNQVRLYNPLEYLKAGSTTFASKVRINVGSEDSDTSPAVSALLALAMKAKGIDTSYQVVWGYGHTDADIENGFESWVESI